LKHGASGLRAAAALLPDYDRLQPAASGDSSEQPANASPLPESAKSSARAQFRALSAKLRPARVFALLGKIGIDERRAGSQALFAAADWLRLVEAFAERRRKAASRHRSLRRHAMSSQVSTIAASSVCDQFRGQGANGRWFGSWTILVV
jgi:hypothetical protein